MNSTSLAASLLASLVIAKGELAELGRLGAVRARDGGHDAAVVGQERRVVAALGAGWAGIAAQPSQLVEEKRRPDDHRGLARQVGGGVLVASWAPWTDAVRIRST